MAWTPIRIEELNEQILDDIAAVSAVLCCPKCGATIDEEACDPESLTSFYTAEEQTVITVVGGANCNDCAVSWVVYLFFDPAAPVETATEIYLDGFTEIRGKLQRAIEQPVVIGLDGADDQEETRPVTTVAKVFSDEVTRRYDHGFWHGTTEANKFGPPWLRVRPSGIANR